MGKKRILAAAAAVCAAYAVWPYVTLYRLGAAIRHGDAAALERLVDWDGVREGIKEDICDTVFEPQEKQVASSDAKLPPFGFSFVRGIAGNVIDSNVTPPGLVTAAHAVELAGPPEPNRSEPNRSEPARHAANPTITWAFFDGPTSFSVLLRPPAAAPGDEPIRIELQLRHGAWKVTRAWLPPAMLTGANART